MFHVKHFFASVASGPTGGGGTLFHVKRWEALPTGQGTGSAPVRAASKVGLEGPCFT